MVLLFFWALAFPYFAWAQPLKEIRVGSSNIREFYRRLVPSLNPGRVVERDKIKLVIDSAVERGLTDKPIEPDTVTDFSIAKQLRF